jgi:hypothetical protein
MMGMNIIITAKAVNRQMVPSVSVWAAVTVDTATITVSRVSVIKRTASVRALRVRTLGLMAMVVKVARIWPPCCPTFRSVKPSFQQVICARLSIQ